MDSASIAISAAAQAQAAAAQAAAERSVCISITKNYAPATATVADMREYANCVFTLHGTGEPMSASAALLIKGMIVLAFIGAAIGGWLGWRDDGPIMAAIGSFIGAVVVAAAVFVLITVAAGVQFLFS
ncbi:hypothetical protein [Bosea sp. AS-1]|uniref:hypothetical protein n=1 Tax=Bosea sp. AS-1 TaxID=2015316 RepID=UPI000B76F4F9|nr:hypothetical protein [Bosea sp. AS-1]